MTQTPNKPPGSTLRAYPAFERWPGQVVLVKTASPNLSENSRQRQCFKKSAEQDNEKYKQKEPDCSGSTFPIYSNSL
jgi:hypothetical protein